VEGTEKTGPTVNAARLGQVVLAGFLKQVAPTFDSQAFGEVGILHGCVLLGELVLLSVSRRATERHP
jgi:hypothetical protein